MTLFQVFEGRYKSLPGEGESYDPPQMVVSPSPPKKAAPPPKRDVPSRAARTAAAPVDYDR